MANTQPEKLLAYQTLLVREARRCGGTGWQGCDTMFRQQVPNDPYAYWSKLISFLYSVTRMGVANHASITLKRTIRDLSALLQQ